MIDEDLVDALTTDLIAALARQEVAEGLERRAALALAEAEEAAEDTPGDERVRTARDRAERAWDDAIARLRTAQATREEIEAEVRLIEPDAVRIAHVRHAFVRNARAGG